jgi:ubiquinone/menaquinone biosynthesis C-methylase UbiE
VVKEHSPGCWCSSLKIQGTATDFDPAQVELARSRLHDLGEAVSFQVFDATDLPFDDGRFDVVFSFGVLHHTARGRRRVVSEVFRVLTQTGAFVFTDIYIAGWFLQRFKVLFPRFA